MAIDYVTSDKFLTNEPLFFLLYKKIYFARPVRRFETENSFKEFSTMHGTLELKMCCFLPFCCKRKNPTDIKQILLFEVKPTLIRRD